MRPPIGAVDGDAFTAGALGLCVERATATLPQTTNAAIFNILGGRVLMLALLGEVTTVIQAQANATKLIATPTVGSAVDICATADINGLEAGGKLMPVNTFATALGKTNAGAAAFVYSGTVLAVGTLNLSCAASNTGSIKWTMYYLPFDVGASVTAA